MLYERDAWPMPRPCLDQNCCIIFLTVRYQIKSRRSSKTNQVGKAIEIEIELIPVKKQTQIEGEHQKTEEG